MTDEDKLRRRIILALDAVVEDEDVALSKLRTVRTVCYCGGAFLVLVCLGEFWGLNWPAWVRSMIGVTGGLVVGIGVHYDNSINQWPVLKPFVDGQKVRDAAAEFRARSSTDRDA